MATGTESAVRSGTQFIEVSRIGSVRRVLINVASIRYISEQFNGNHERITTIYMGSGGSSGDSVVTGETLDDLAERLAGPPELKLPNDDRQPRLIRLRDNDAD